MALSLRFDDGRESQVTQGLPVFARHGARSRCIVVPSAVELKLNDWKRAVAAGHEIGNHSLTHSCSGNFPFSRQKALEDHSIPRMRDELVEANRRIATLLGVTPRTFAYPCGQTFVGRGKNTQSYVPVVAELFLAGRGWLDEAANDPAFVDLAQTLGVEMDGKDFAQIRPLLDDARKRAAPGWCWPGTTSARGGRQTTRVAMLDELFAYAKDPANGIWLATVAEAADQIVAPARPASHNDPSRHSIPDVTDDGVLSIKREGLTMAQLELVALLVREDEPAIDFFVRVLQFELVEDSPSLTNDGRPKRWVVVRPRGGATDILLARADGADQAEIVGRQFAGRVGLFLRVDDFEAAFERMRLAGVVFASSPRVEPYGRVAVFLDPRGIVAISSAELTESRRPPWHRPWLEPVASGSAQRFDRIRRRRAQGGAETGGNGSQDQHRRRHRKGDRVVRSDAKQQIPHEASEQACPNHAERDAEKRHRKAFPQHQADEIGAPRAECGPNRKLANPL